MGDDFITTDVTDIMFAFLFFELEDEVLRGCRYQFFPGLAVMYLCSNQCPEN